MSQLKKFLKKIKKNSEKIKNKKTLDGVVWHCDVK